MKIKIVPKRFFICLVFILSLYIGCMHYKAIIDSINISNEKARYTALIADEREQNEKLKNAEENLNTAGSYEEIARDNLGLLKSDEILYVNADRK